MPLKLDPQYAPSDLTPFTTCKTRNFSNPRFRIGGLIRTYKSSSQINYAASNWEGRLPVLWEGLNQDILGVPGINVDNGSVTPPYIGENVRIAVIDVRQVGGVPHCFYLSNSTALHPIENWSSTKVLAVIAAGQHLRSMSSGRLGLDASLSGMPLGRFVSSIGWVSDNRTAAWFKTVMGPEKTSNFLVGWIGKGNYDYNRNRSIAILESFGGRYGAPPRDTGPLRTIFRRGKEVLKIDRDQFFSGDNTLAPLTIVEAWKRVLVGQKDPTTNRLRISLTEADKQVLLYGEKADDGFGGFLFGGSKQRFVNTMGGKEKLERMSGGRWRLFGKTGSGRSRVRNRTEATMLLGICIPEGGGSLSDGREIYLFVNAQAAAGKSNARAVADKAIQNLVEYMIPQLPSL